MGLPLQQIIAENQPYLGKPIRPDKSLEDIVPPKHMEYVRTMISTHLFVQDETLQARADSKVKAYFGGRPMQFVVVNHSPELRRDMFCIRRGNGVEFIYVGSDLYTDCAPELPSEPIDDSDAWKDA